MKIIKINEKQAKERIDKALAGIITELSRSQIQKLIKEGKVLVNNSPASAHYTLKDGDKVTINKKKDKKENIKEKLKEAPVVPIIAETGDYLVVDKPAGLITHSAGHIKKFTLADIMIEKYPGIKKVGDDPLRPGIVHRLDKEASGLMVIAKNQKFFDWVKKQFQDRKVEKKYIALVYGPAEKEEDVIDFPIERSAAGHKMAAKPKNQGGKPAVTELKLIKQFINYTLLEAKIKTGRTHQIRCHLAAWGHPIVGDDLYGTKKTRERNQKLGLGRIFLSAVRLGFDDLSGERKIFEIDIPPKLKEVLEKIK